MKLAESSKGVVRLSVPTAFLRSWINGHYLDLMLAELWKQEEPDVLKVEIVVRTTTKQGRGAPEHEQLGGQKGRAPAASRAWPRATLPPARSERPPQAKGMASQPEQRQSVLGSPLDNRYTFQSFIEGPSNRVAFAAARAVAEQSVERALQPAVPACDRRTRQDASAAGHRGGIAEADSRRRASST